MDRELLILRHGKSDWGAGVDDLHRPITDRGKRGAQRIAVWLQGQGLVPDYIVSSPAERAITTAQKACKAMWLDARSIQQDRRIYAAGVGGLLAVLADCPLEAQRVLLVGHNPGLEGLLRYLGGHSVPVPDDGKLLPTATLARLAMPRLWSVGELSQDSAQLLSLTRPKSLPKKFPFPAPGAAQEDQRDRPAYYYSQSSVIPFRRHKKKGVEILVIASSQNKHTVVPKGIMDPGLSAQESAAKEAWEEAGVEGVVDEQALGSYRYAKWGAECTVEVFPLEVTREVPEAEWQERHRGREWVSPKTAAKTLKQRQLAPLIEVLVQRVTGA